MRLSAIPEAQRAEAVSKVNARFGEMERVLWKVRITAALAVGALLAGALAGCETPRDRDARICATAADPVPIANQVGATYLGDPVPEGSDGCILSADGNNATRTGTWDFEPGGQLITVSTFSSQADYDSQLATDGYGSPPDRVVVIPGKLAIIDTASPVTVASRVGGQVITPQPPPAYTPPAVTPPP
jgi:hypothetical protein